MPTTKNPCDFPAPLLEWIDRSFTCEFSTLTSAGQPLTHPITPHASVVGRTVDLATGLAFPPKAERARRRPQVGILFSDPTGSGMRDAPVVLVKGEATVRDADLQANTDRYVAISTAKFATISRFIPPSFQRAGAWYYARIWVHVTPREILVFPRGDTDRTPEIWRAPEAAMKDEMMHQALASLDLLRAPNHRLRRLGEDWLRTNLLRS